MNWQKPYFSSKILFFDVQAVEFVVPSNDGFQGLELCMI